MNIKQVLALAAIAVAATVTAAEAIGPPPGNKNHGKPPGLNKATAGSVVTTAPEFDARVAGAAVALLVGGALVLTSRRRGSVAS